MNKQIVIGEKFGELTVINYMGVDSSRHKMWKCKCECGNEIIVRGTDLNNNKKVNCGHDRKVKNFINEVNNRYGRLLVLEQAPKPPNVKSRGIYWKCKCDCGNITVVRASDLRNGKTKSCGCFMNEARGQSIVKDEVGNRYGKLTVIRRADKSIRGMAAWYCRCDCGNYINAAGAELRRGLVKSCGCMQSWGEQQILSFLQRNQLSYKKEFCFKDLVTPNNGHPRFDFAIFNNNKLYCLIEYQGVQHFKDKGGFGQRQREGTDLLKKNYCEEHNITLYEIFYYDNVEESLQQILQPLCEHK